MHNLYFKIFLWFWLAMALVGVAFVVSTVTLQNSEADARWRSFLASGLNLSGQSAVDAYQAHGQRGLVDFFERMERRYGIRAYLYDKDLQELSGRRTPAAGAALAESAVTRDDLAVEEFDDSRLVALSLTSPEGETFVLLADMEWPFRGGGRDNVTRRGGRVGGASRSNFSADGFRGSGRRDRRPWYSVWMSAVDEPGALALRMLAIFLTAGILCYGLARYLSAPVLRLRDATHRITSGDLSVRVGPAVGGRRDELAELGRDFDLMAERIESLLTAQGQLLSDVSHELRSPLARLNVALALARQRAGPDAAGPLDRIESEAEQLNSLIGRVLTLARFESGAMDPEFADVDLVRLVRDIGADADFEADPKGTSVVVMEPEPCRVRGNESLLRSAIENVVRNAVRYAAAGTNVEISLEPDRRPAREVATPGPREMAAQGSREVVISVRDYGPGVPVEQLADLFEPFYRIADSRDRGSGGTGLGLSITDRAVRLHGGTVIAANAPGGGLIIEIHLPG